MRYALFILAATAAFAGRAQLGAAASTNRIYTSEVVLSRAWKRQVVMQDGEGRIFNDSRAVGDAAESAAAGEVSERASEISDAANTSMTNSLRVLEEAKKNAATNSLAFALVIMPETSRTNLTSYVVKTETSGAVDTQYVWFNKQIDLEPNRFVVYQTHDRCATNKVTWIGWQSTTNVTYNGRTWEGCHVCTVTRPKWAVGKPCLSKPNDVLGGPRGFDFGDMTLTVGGEPLYTGFVTNGITGEVLYFDNGVNKGPPQEEP